MPQPVLELVTVDPVSGQQLNPISSGMCGYISARRLVEQLERSNEWHKRYKVVALTFHSDGSIRYWLEYKE